MTKRRQAMERLLQVGAVEPAAAAEAPTAVRAGADRTMGAGAVRTMGAGAVRTMGLALDRLGAESRAEAVEEIDPALCDPSFVRDRLDDEEGEGADIAALADSIASGGQAVPILLRPHPAVPGRYQIAYGHRRWLACRRLERTVKAIVRPLDDDTLVVAQGRENNSRRDLTFIERAEFAAALVRRGMPRAVIGRALGVDKSELARLLAVAEGLPDGLARQIGRAPKAGRPRWLRLLELCRARGGSELALATAARVQHLATDARFRMVLDALTPVTPDEAALPDNLPVRIQIGPRVTVITIDEIRAAGFGHFLADRIEALYDEFLEASGRRGGS